jgi:adenosylcobinamide kinase/adenosylcobinamide-phosphate guanylyltransferase
MIVLFIGGQKSGKSKLAEKYTLKISQNKKPYYIATYDNSYNDKQMTKKIKLHKKQRKNKFVTINETKRLDKIIDKYNTYIVDCISMWILNTLDTKIKKLKKQLKYIKNISKNSNIVLVLNDVNQGIIPLDKTTRKFVDRTGVIGQYLANISDVVYDVRFGIKVQIK